MSADGMGWWSPPVPVRGDRIGVTDNISSAVRAIEKLDEWGGKDKPKLRKAIKACEDALEGQGSIANARQTFVDAARQTGNLMGFGQ